MENRQSTHNTGCPNLSEGLLHSNAQNTLRLSWKTTPICRLVVLHFSINTECIDLKMVKTKMTPQRSDVSGKLPPLGRPRRPDSNWGTAAKTFVQKFTIPMNPNVRGALDYRSKSKGSK